MFVSEVEIEKAGTSEHLSDISKSGNRITVSSLIMKDYSSGIDKVNHEYEMTSNPYDCLQAACTIRRMDHGEYSLCVSGNEPMLRRIATPLLRPGPSFPVNTLKINARGGRSSTGPANPTLDIQTHQPLTQGSGTPSDVRPRTDMKIKKAALSGTSSDLPGRRVDKAPSSKPVENILPANLAYVWHRPTQAKTHITVVVWERKSI